MLANLLHDIQFRPAYLVSRAQFSKAGIGRSFGNLFWKHTCFDYAVSRHSSICEISSSLAMFCGELDVAPIDGHDNGAEADNGAEEPFVDEAVHAVPFVDEAVPADVDEDVRHDASEGDDDAVGDYVVTEADRLAAGRYEQSRKSQSLMGQAVVPGASPTKKQRVINLPPPPPPPPQPKASSPVVVDGSDDGAQIRLGFQIAKAAAAQRQKTQDYETMKQKEKDLKSEQLLVQSQMRDRERRVRVDHAGLPPGLAFDLFERQPRYQCKTNNTGQICGFG